MKLPGISFLTVLAVLLPLATQGKSARPPVYLGMSAALSGPAQSLGSGMKADSSS
jgi:hypothetical protein